MSAIVGGILVALGGLLTGGSAWPMKIIRKYRFENWWFVSMFFGLVILPWLVTLTSCPHVLAAYRQVDPWLIVKANLFSLGWGIANVLCGLCYVQIGFALTGGILTGLGVSIGVTVPLIVKGSGLFANAPNLRSPAGYVILCGVGVILGGVCLVALAGFGRERLIGAASSTTGSFRAGLLMVIVSGILSVGLSFSFVFSQDAVIRAVKAQGAGDMAANFAVWAISLTGGALINLLYPAYLMKRNHSWRLLLQSRKDAALSMLIGATMAAAVAVMGKGMLLLGALGASVGFGIQQSAQMLANQGVGFISGEWKGVRGRPRRQMYMAIILLIIATVILSYGNTLGKIK